MRKIVFNFFIVIVLCVGIVLPISVDASYAYAWGVDGETLHKGSSNKAGTASWVDDSTYTGGVLVLNNYDGGQLHIECYGTGLGHVFAVKLVGNNKITVKDGIGIIANAPVVFIGDGKLEISAAIPIGSGHVYVGENTGTEIQNAKWAGGTTITIEPSKDISECNCPEIIENDNVQSDSSVSKDFQSSELGESNKEKDSNKDDNKSECKNDNILSSNIWVNIAVLLYFVISLIAIVLLILKLNSGKKKNKSKSDD